ncbi:MAG TPA: RbsD/FucU family protein [Fimbriimonas sp.]
MLKTELLHPEILAALASAGHGSKVLIADSNYPFTTGSSPEAQIVYLNLAPGKLNAVEILGVIARSIPIEAAEVMVPDTGAEPAIFTEFRSVLGSGLALTARHRFEFYDAAKASDVCLTIASGEQRIYANILLTIGVVPPP